MESGTGTMTALKLAGTQFGVWQKLPGDPFISSLQMEKKTMKILKIKSWSSKMPLIIDHYSKSISGRK